MEDAGIQGDTLYPKEDTPGYIGIHVYLNVSWYILVYPLDLLATKFFCLWQTSHSMGKVPTAASKSVACHGFATKCPCGARPSEQQQ